MKKRIKKKKEQYYKNLIKALNNPEKQINDELFKYLVNQRIELIELGHMDFDDVKLQMLAPYVNEVRMTLLERAYSDKKYSADKFKEYLFNYASQLADESNLLLLLEREGKDVEKKEILLEYCKVFKTKKICEIAKSLELANQVLESQDICFIEKVYNMYLDNPYILLAVAKNSITPEKIIKQLKNVKGIKFAREIRNISNERN